MNNIVIPFGRVTKCKNKYVEIYTGDSFALFKKNKNWKLSKKASLGQWAAMCPDGTVIYASTDDLDKILRNAKMIEEAYEGIL